MTSLEWLYSWLYSWLYMTLLIMALAVASLIQDLKRERDIDMLKARIEILEQQRQ